MSRVLAVILVFGLIVGFSCSPTTPVVDEQNSTWLCYPYYVNRIAGNYFDVYIALDIDKFSGDPKPFVIGLNGWRAQDVILLKSSGLEISLDGKSYLIHTLMMGGQVYTLQAGKRWCGLYSDSTVWLGANEINLDKYARGPQFAFYADTLTNLITPVPPCTSCP